MKLKPILFAVTLAVFAAAAATAIAAEMDKHEVVTIEQGEAKKPVKKSVRKHSHMEEKTNIPMPKPMHAEGKEVSKNRHDHTKEKH